jgi:hypothetical protein
MAKAPALGSKKNSPSKHLAKAALPADVLALSIDRPSALKVAKKLAKDLKAILAEVGADVAKSVEMKLNKADATAADEADSIAATIDLSGLLAMASPIREASTSIARESGKLSLGAIGVDDPLLLIDQVNESAVEWAREHVAELLSAAGETNETLIETTRDLVRNIIANGLEENVGGADVIADRIEESLAFSEYRAEMIANTEIAFANAAGKKAGWDAAAATTNLPMVKQWFISEDEGVCDECEGNAAQDEIPYDESFESGDDMEPAHPNCRCVTTARIVEPDGEATSDDSEGEGNEE